MTRLNERDLPVGHWNLHKRFSKADCFLRCLLKYMYIVWPSSTKITEICITLKTNFILKELEI